MSTENLIKTRFENGRGKSSVLVVDFQTNALDGHVFRELNKILDNVENLITRGIDRDEGNKIGGVIFTSTKRKIFLAGADLYQLNDIIDVPVLLKEVINIGQDTFNRIENLNITTVAAINGVCLGGGYELTLACDYRICANDKTVKIGLPEVNLGILPAWGGTTRLPRLVNLPTALKVILGGGQMAAKPALKAGLVDLIIHKEHLLSTALDVVRGKKVIKRKKFDVFDVVPDTIILNKAKKNVRSKTNGNYPAPERIIKILSTPCMKRESLQLERKAFLDLCKTKEMRNLLRIFFLQEQSKKLKHEAGPYIDPSGLRPLNVSVLGAGTMGAGIAQWTSSRGVRTVLKDVNDELVSNGLKTAGKLYVAGVHSHAFDRAAARDGLARLTGCSKDVPLNETDIVIEAIVENIHIKREVLSQIEKRVLVNSVIATNTSALSINELASSLMYPERFIGIHFFNPVHKMKLVEIVKGVATDDETIDKAVRFVQKIGKFPVVVKDSPGFIVNRILMPYLLASSSVLQSGYSCEDVDKSVVKFGMPMGPFRLMDEIGLDICYHVARDLKERLPIFDIDVSGIQELVKRIGQGNLGKKTGEGFYKYDAGKSIKNKSQKLFDCEPLVNTMVVEAERCMGEQIIDDPNMLDFAMIMGTGWAPFRGGPLTYKKS